MKMFIEGSYRFDILLSIYIYILLKYVWKGNLFLILYDPLEILIPT